MPLTQTGLVPVQLASPVHWLPVGCVQTPLEQVAPFAHALDVPHPATHWPSAQISFAAQSLVYLQMSAGGVHAFAMQTLPPVQSEVAVQGHGPFVPPHAWQRFATQADPLEQSAVVLQPFGVQAPETQTPPVVQSAVVVQVHAGFDPPQAVQVLAMQVCPEPQSLGCEH